MAENNNRLEDKLFEKRIIDMINASSDKYIDKFSVFLNERQISMAVSILRQEQFQNYMFFGGHENSERMVLGTFGMYETPDASNFPIIPITVSFNAKYTLSHRDFLGALMNLLIKREAVGDILVGEGICVIFLLTTVVEIVLQELTKVGRVGVSCTLGLPKTLPEIVKTTICRASIASTRTEVVVAALTNLSREKALRLVQQGLVIKNHQIVLQPDKKVMEGDQLSIRGFGKFIIDSFDGFTKKGRIHFTYRKFI